MVTENLVLLLIAAVEDDGDSRAMQTEAVLNAVFGKLSKAHLRIDQQEASHSRLFLASFAQGAIRPGREPTDRRTGHPLTES